MSHTAIRYALAFMTGLAVAAGARASGTPSGSAAVLSWAAPTVNRDGSTLVDLIGFNVYHGTSPETMMLAATVPGAVRNYVDADLPPGLWYWCVTAINGGGRESAPSATVSKPVEVQTTPPGPAAAVTGSAATPVGTGAAAGAGPPPGGAPKSGGTAPGDQPGSGGGSGGGNDSAAANGSGSEADSQPESREGRSAARSRRNLCRPAGAVVCFGRG
jgi:hypothetical protein